MQKRMAKVWLFDVTMPPDEPDNGRKVSSPPVLKSVEKKSHLKVVK